MRTFEEAQLRHAAAIEAFAARAQAVPHNRWMAAPAEGKWSPAAVTMHLTLSFEALDRELLDGTPMKMRVAGMKLFMVRMLVMRRILRDGHFPSGAPAPRETRPQDLAPQPEGLRRFREAASRLDAAIVKAREERPRIKLTHPYFGQVGLTDAVFVSARHIEHHMKQLPA